MMFDMLYSVLQQRWLNKIGSFPHKNELMLHIKYLSDSHQEEGNNCFCQCTISRLSWVEIIENGSITIKWLTQALKCPQDALKDRL